MGGFAALLAPESEALPARIAELTLEELEDDDVTVAIEWSSLNYKDALAVTGRGRIVRKTPMVCGIDLAGRVASSRDGALQTGELVAVTGCGLGEDHFGGYAAYARVPAAWCVPLPPGIDAYAAMALGTAGVTAMLAILALERNGSGADALDGLPLLVTGASGGVGSLAIVLAARLGYQVLASTGRLGEAAYLRSLGAHDILAREELAGSPPRPLEHVRFGAAIDVVGGRTLAHVLAATRPGGTVAACGLAGGADLPTSVHPFILRGVTLAGINSVHLEPELRRSVWARLARDMPLDLLDRITTRAHLADVPRLAQELLAGQVRGRVVVAPEPPAS
ncbi:MAG TPA: MDR family oxidoreductase [Acidimicrobiales bacterium]|nr:MDR family oxidoreductase [Acidimicrobiales bacterium]